MVRINQEGVIIDMYIKKIKRKCGVRGCKNIDNVYIISKSREMSYSLILCKDCMKEALAMTDEYVEPKKVVKVDRPLFPHPELAVTISSVADVKEPEPQEVIEIEAEEDSVAVAEDNVTIEGLEPISVDTVVEEAPKPKATPTKSNSNKKKSTKKR